jgi:hypothetical protein
MVGLELRGEAVVSSPEDPLHRRLASDVETHVACLECSGRMDSSMACLMCSCSSCVHGLLLYLMVHLFIVSNDREDVLVKHN